MFLIYTRRSTDDAQNQKNTLENQEKQCMRYAKDHKLSIAKESIAGLMTNGIIYERHSGWKSSPITVSGAGLVEYQIERPKFMQMISLLVQKQYEGIIVMCWDRISRNPNDDIIIKDLIDNKHIRILFVWIFSSVLLVFFGIPNLYYNNIGISAGFILLFSYFLYLLFKKNKFLGGMAILVIMASNISLVSTQNPKGDQCKCGSTVQ